MQNNDLSIKSNLRRLSNPLDIKKVFETTLYEMIAEALRDVPNNNGNGNIDLNKYRIAGIESRDSSTGYFLYRQSIELGQKVNEVGQLLGKKRFAIFHEGRTYLPPEDIKAIWKEIDGTFGQKIVDARKLSHITETEEGTEESPVKDIPGLRQAIEDPDSSIRPRALTSIITLEDVEYLRGQMVVKLSEFNDQELFWNRARSNLCTLWKNEYNLGKEGVQDPLGLERLFNQRVKFQSASPEVEK